MVDMSSNKYENVETSWKSGGNLIEISRKGANRAESKGSDLMGRWIQMDLMGKKGKMISLISAYYIYQENVAKAGGTTQYKQ